MRIKEMFAFLAASGFKKYFFNTAWLFVDQVLRLVVGVFVGIWVARYLGPSGFGVLSYALALISILSVLAKMGLDTLVVRDLVHEPEQIQISLGTSFWLKFGGGLLTFLAAVVYVLAGNEDDVTNKAVLILGAALFFQAAEVTDFYFQARVQSKYISICKTLQLVLSTALKLYFIFIKADLLMFVIVHLIDQVSLSLLQLGVYFRVNGNLRFLAKFNSEKAMALLRNSWPLVFSSIVIMIYMRIDQIMIKRILSSNDVGLFSAAVRLSEAWYFVPMVISNSLFPAILNARKSDHAEYQKRVQALLSLMVVISLAVAIPFTFVSPWLIVFLFGEGYAGAGSALSIHIWAGLFVSLGVGTSAWFIGENLQKIGLVKSVVGVLLNIGLNLLLLPRYGINGAAFATLITQAMVSVLMNLAVPQTRPIFRMQVRAFVINPKTLILWKVK